MCTRANEDATYEKVTTSEWDPAFQVPCFTFQEVEGILEDVLLHTSIKDDRLEGAFRTRGDEAPFVPYGGSVD